MMVLDTPLFAEELPERAAGKGQVRFVLRSSAPDDIALVGFCANIASSLLFERLQAQGTNIVMSLPKEGGRIDVLARTENDGLDLAWTPAAAEPAQLSEIQERIRSKTFFIGKETPSPAAVPSSAVPAASQGAAQALPSLPSPMAERPDGSDGKDLSEEEEDYLVKQLHRIP